MKNSLVVFFSCYLYFYIEKIEHFKLLWVCLLVYYFACSCVYRSRWPRIPIFNLVATFLPFFFLAILLVATKVGFNYINNRGPKIQPQYYNSDLNRRDLKHKWHFLKSVICSWPQWISSWLLWSFGNHLRMLYKTGYQMYTFSVPNCLLLLLYDCLLLLLNRFPEP